MKNVILVQNVIAIYFCHHCISPHSIHHNTHFPTILPSPGLNTCYWAKRGLFPSFLWSHHGGRDDRPTMVRVRQGASGGRPIYEDSVGADVVCVASPSPLTRASSITQGTPAFYKPLPLWFSKRQQLSYDYHRDPSHWSPGSELKMYTYTVINCWSRSLWGCHAGHLGQA